MADEPTGEPTPVATGSTSPIAAATYVLDGYAMPHASCWDDAVLLEGQEWPVVHQFERYSLDTSRGRSHLRGMVTVALLVILAIGALLVPDLRAEPGTWIFSVTLIATAVVLATRGRTGRTLQTARQVKYWKWFGYTSHDGTGERDMREKRGDQ